MRTEQLAVVLAGDELAQANLVFHRPAVGGVAKVLCLDGNLKAFTLGRLACLLFGHTDHGDLRVAEDRAGYVAVVAGAQVLGVAEIVLHNACFVVCHVLELVAAGHVAEGVDAGYGCAVVEHALVLIDAELTAVLHVEVVLRVEGVGVGAATGRHEHCVCRDFEQFFTVLGGALSYDGHAAVGVLTDFGEGGILDDVPLLAYGFFETCHNLFVHAAQQAGGAVQLGYFGAECGENVGEFCRNHAAADDDHAGGQLVQAHDIVVGVDLRGVDTGYGRQHGARTCRNDNLTALQAGAVGQLNRVGADETRVLVVEVDVGQTGTPFAAAFNNRVNAGGEDTVANLRPVHGIYVCIDAQVLDLAGLLRDGRRVDVHLGGDAANVQAGAAEDTAVDEGDLLVVPFGADEGVAGSGADDDEVVLCYAVNAFYVLDAHVVLSLMVLRLGSFPACPSMTGLFLLLPL